MNALIQKYITGTTAVKIASDIDGMIRQGHLGPGSRLPPVRDLARDLGVSPATVASAYQSLQARAVLVAQGRRGTRVSHRPMAGARRGHAAPSGAVDLSDGNPDPALLPEFRSALRTLAYSPRLYGADPMHAGLIKLISLEMKADGVDVRQCAIVNGTMDGLDRLLAEHLRPGDRVAVEDPGFTGHHDLIASRGLTLVPVAVDEQGVLPHSLERACSQRLSAVLITSRAQSPTGAAVSADRARDLRRIIEEHSEVLVIEDDHASFLSAAPYERVYDRKGRWAHLRSFSKAFNPDLRLAVMTGDDQTMTRVLDRLVVGERWVSHILQMTAYALLSDRTVRAKVKRAGEVYDRRREALIEALADVDLHAMGRTGFNIWLPVDEETATVQPLAAAGWAVAAGERFRLSSPPGIRITASRIEPAQSRSFAKTLGHILSPARRAPVA